MASKRIASAGARLSRAGSGLVTRDPLMQCLAPSLSRSLATEVSAADTIIDNASPRIHLNVPITPSFPLRRPPPPQQHVLATVHSFPTMEPLRFEQYPANHLYLPLRKDILHRAIIFEGDGERQGTASTKWRSEVHGSGRKIRPQKGTGMARLGDKKSPMLKGGGVTFGPKPRDFSTKLNKKMYDLAWRTALSYRYRRGQLLVVEDGLDLELAEPRWFDKVMSGNKIGRADGGSLVVTSEWRRNLWDAAAGSSGKHAKVKAYAEVDVKNLLEMGRIVIEKSALDSIIAEHSSDLNMTVPSAVY